MVVVGVTEGPFLQRADAPRVDSLTLSFFPGLPSLWAEGLPCPLLAFPSWGSGAAPFPFLTLLPLARRPASPSPLPRAPRRPPFCPLVSLATPLSVPSLPGHSASAHTPGTLNPPGISVRSDS